jgi:hypothetical protein
MSTLQKKIADKYLETLADGKEVDSEQVEKIRKLLGESKKLKAQGFLVASDMPN